ncbi:hypothetical protein [Oceanobacillus oncorhynchi]|uniref:hypothetical protein n=1 Tax=Oceanobacillus oncorhynchi TaxID=545501 RepID=UPI0034D5CFDC
MTKLTVNEYQETIFDPGITINEAVSQLQELNSKGKKAKGEFNGVTLYSDTVNVDGAYLSITGRTEADHKDLVKSIHENFKKDEEKHKENIPQLTDKYIKLGQEVLDESKWRKWEEIVPIRLRDLYRGMELDCCLDIIKVLNREPSAWDSEIENDDWILMNEATDIFESQNHSGMSANLVANMVEQFAVGNIGSYFKKRVL